MKNEKDQYGYERRSHDKDMQAVMEWEKPYMKACVDALKPSGDVLEVGFGMGYSSTYFQEHPIKSHTIIESDPLIAKKAKEWAKGHHNVKIIEDIWQNALGKLGMFDVIFFDDYPLETLKEVQALRNFSQEGAMAIKQGQQLIADIHLQFPFLDDLHYQDQDLDMFFKHIKGSHHVDPHHFLPFFYDLKLKRNITEAQFEKIVDRLLKDHMITREIKEEFFKKSSSPKAVAPIGLKSQHDRLFQFLERCIKSHMRIGSRFSCYLDDPSSKYQDGKFFNHIITNPALDYHEHLIDVKIPKDCKYYSSDKALVMVVTKRS